MSNTPWWIRQPQRIVITDGCSITAQVFPALEQGGLTVGQLPAVIDEHPWITEPSLLITVEPADPEPFAIDQPALPHAPASAYVLAGALVLRQRFSLFLQPSESLNSLLMPIPGTAINV